jgi:hypothetical protein
MPKPSNLKSKGIPEASQQPSRRAHRAGIVNTNFYERRHIGFSIDPIYFFLSCSCSFRIDFAMGALMHHCAWTQRAGKGPRHQ